MPHDHTSYLDATAAPIATDRHLARRPVEQPRAHTVYNPSVDGQAPKENPLLGDYPVVAEVEIRWGDIDLLGHVNNIMYLQYFETARIEYFMSAGLDPPGSSSREFGFIVASQHCRYKAPLTFPDTVDVGARVWALSKDRMVIRHAVHSRRLGKIAAMGDVLLVAYDFNNSRRIPIPDKVRASVVTIEGKELPEPPSLKQLRSMS